MKASIINGQWCVLALSLTAGCMATGQRSAPQEIESIRVVIQCASGSFDRTTGATSVELQFDKVQGLSKAEISDTYCTGRNFVDRIPTTVKANTPLVAVGKPFNVRYRCTGQAQRMLFKVQSDFIESTFRSDRRLITAKMDTPRSSARQTFEEPLPTAGMAAHRYISKVRNQGHTTQMTLTRVSQTSINVASSFHDGNPLSWPYAHTEEPRITIEHPALGESVRLIEKLDSGFSINLFASAESLGVVRLYAADRDTLLVTSILWPYSIQIPMAGTRIMANFDDGGAMTCHMADKVEP